MVHGDSRKGLNLWQKLAVVSLMIPLIGCESLMGTPLDVPPEYDQKVALQVADSYQVFQAVLSTYDVGDLQNFHTQHTLPIIIEDAFKDLFGQVEMQKPGARINANDDVPAIFEVKLIDLANDVYNEADNYRAKATLAVAMKSPKGTIFWQKAFRGMGYVRVDPQDSIALGPQDAVVNAIQDAIDQMKESIAYSPEVLNQMRYYQTASQAQQAAREGF